MLIMQDAASSGLAARSGSSRDSALPRGLRSSRAATCELGARERLPGRKAPRAHAARARPAIRAARWWASARSRSPDDLKLWHAAGLSRSAGARQTYRLATPLPAGGRHSVRARLARRRLSVQPLSRRARDAGRASLVAPAGADITYAEAAASATALARDLINTPANDLGPAELAQAAVDLAAPLRRHASKVIVGEELKARELSADSRGRARAARARRGSSTCAGASRSAPRVTLVGKGVCFDSGGLDIKPSAGMLLMKKDMGGAAVRARRSRSCSCSSMRPCNCEC